MSNITLESTNRIKNIISSIDSKTGYKNLNLASAVQSLCDGYISDSPVYSFGVLSDLHIQYETGYEDFQRALTYLNDKVPFTCVCGDLVSYASSENMAKYKEYITNYAGDMSVYECAGNHESYPAQGESGDIDSALWLDTTGKQLYYTFNYCDDVFIMLSMKSERADDLFPDGGLEWLQSTLESNKDKRCFVFFHAPNIADKCADPSGTWASLMNGTSGNEFLDIINQYKNVVWFHGHTHVTLGVEQVPISQNLGYRSVHIPSLVSPRFYDTTTNSLVDYYYDSNNNKIWGSTLAEGYIVDVYENKIVLRGINYAAGADKKLVEEFADEVYSLNTMQKITSNNYVPHITHSDIPNYVKSEVTKIVNKVNSVKNNQSIVFVSITDPHHATDESTSWKSNIDVGNLDACRAIKSIAYVLPIDFVTFLGDLTFGYYTTTAEQFEAQCKEYHSWIDEGFKEIPQLWTPGNHDTGEYLAKEWTSNGTTRAEDLTKLYGSSLLKKYFSDYNIGAIYGDETVGYCYRDFDDKKIRVINLNTVESEITEGENATSSLSSAQLLWFAQTLYSLGSKSDSTDWGFIVLGHYPLDWGYVRDAGKILKAYIDGSSITVNDTTVNFYGNNGATCYGNFHGHLHNFKSSKIYVIPDNVSSSNPPTEQMNALRVCTPSANFYRNNEVGDNDRLDSNQIEFGDETTYDKTADTANDTAFCVNVINPNEHKIYSFCYGSGYDRTLSFDFNVIMHSISSSLTHCSISNAATAIEDGSSYTTTLTLDNGYSFDSITVTMGETDITSSAYTNGVITISSVTGDVVITAIASKPVNYTNLILSAISNDGSSLLYKDSYSMNSSGAEESMGGFTLSGFIPIGSDDAKGTMVSTNHIYRLGGDGITWSSSEEYCRVAWYNESFELLKMVPSKRIDSSAYFPSSIAESTTAVTFKVTNDSGDIVSNVPSTAAYFRIAAKGIGENMIVTLDEQIE